MWALSFLWNPTPIWFLLLLIGSCAKVRHSSRTTRRSLVETCPSCCLFHYMEMEHPFLELESHGLRWAISSPGAACSWVLVTANWLDSWSSWSMLTWGAQIVCLRSYDSMKYVSCLVTSNIVPCVYVTFCVLLLLIWGALSLGETRWIASSTWWGGVLLLSMQASGQGSIGLALPSTTRKGWARSRLKFLLSLYSLMSLM